MALIPRIAAAALLGLTGQAVASPSNDVRLIGVTEIAADAGPGGLSVGGVSGIDHDPRSDRWVLVSDDKSEHGPARFWTATIDVLVDRPPMVRLTTVVPLRSDAGQPFPPAGSGMEAADAESIRFDPRTDELLWSSEGDARDGFGTAVRRIAIDGTPKGKLRLPPVFAFDPAARRGPRPNLAIEGLTFAQRGHRLWMSLEAPMFGDGPLASGGAGADVRFTAIDTRSNGLLRQVTYRVEPIGPTPPERLADNGVSEILAVDDGHLLVLERSGVQQDDKDFRFRARLYCATLAGATDTRRIAALVGARYRPVRKRVIFDFAGVPSPRIDNVEGMAWGPRLANGHASLVFVTDNDFSPQRVTQVIALDAGSDREAVARRLCPR